MRDELAFAVVDEADSILIDESRNPMIISSQGAYDQGLVVLVDKVRRCTAAAAAARGGRDGFSQRRACVRCAVCAVCPPRVRQ